VLHKSDLLNSLRDYHISGINPGQIDSYLALWYLEDRCSQQVSDEHCDADTFLWFSSTITITINHKTQVFFIFLWFDLQENYLVLNKPRILMATKNTTKVNLVYNQILFIFWYFIVFLQKILSYWLLKDPKTFNIQYRYHFSTNTDDIDPSNTESFHRKALPDKIEYEKSYLYFAFRLNV
jgi:hypothetical protein